jgi:hypothetical protein
MRNDAVEPPLKVTLSRLFISSLILAADNVELGANDVFRCKSSLKYKVRASTITVEFVEFRSALSVDVYVKNTQYMKIF